MSIFTIIVCLALLGPALSSLFMIFMGVVSMPQWARLTLGGVVGLSLGWFYL